MAKSSEFGFGFFVRVWVILSLCLSLGLAFTRDLKAKGNGDIVGSVVSSTNELGLAGVEWRERFIIRRKHY